MMQFSSIGLSRRNTQMTYKMKNEKLNKWVQEINTLCQPDKIYWCDGTKKEYATLMAKWSPPGRQRR